LETGESFYEEIYFRLSEQNQTTTVATLLKRMIDKILWPTLSLVTQRILSIGKKTDYFSKHVNGLITNFSTIRPHSSLSSPPNQFIINGIGRSEKKIIDGELKKKNDRLHNQIDTFAVRTIGCISHSAKREKHQFNRFYLLFSLVFFTQSIYNY
jgi:hypothetical protein